METIQRRVSTLWVNLPEKWRLCFGACASIYLATITTLEIELLKRRIVPNMGPFASTISFLFLHSAVSVSYLGLWAIAECDESPSRIKLKNRYYQVSWQGLGRAALMASSLITLGDRFFRATDQYSFQKISPFQRELAENILFGAVSIGSIAASFFALKPVSTYLPKDVSPLLEEIPQAKSAGDNKQRNLGEVVIKGAMKIAEEAQEGVEKIDCFLRVAEHRPSGELFDRIRQMIEESQEEQFDKNFNFLRLVELECRYDLEKAQLTLKKIIGPTYSHQLWCRGLIATAMIEQLSLDEAKAYVQETPMEQMEDKALWAKIVRREAEERGLEVAWKTAQAIQDRVSKVFALIEYAIRDPSYKWVPSPEIFNWELLRWSEVIQYYAVHDLEKAIEQVGTLGERLPHDKRAKWQAMAYLDIAKVDSVKGKRLALEKVSEIQDPYEKALLTIKLAEIDSGEGLKKTKALLPQIVEGSEKARIVSEIVRLEVKNQDFDAARRSMLDFPSGGGLSGLKLSSVDTIFVGMAQSNREVAIEKVLSSEPSGGRQIDLLFRILDWSSPTIKPALHPKASDIT